MRELLFDYSLASEFISDSEIEEMRTEQKKLRKLYFQEVGKAMDSLDGLISLLSLTIRNLNV